MILYFINSLLITFTLAVNESVNQQDDSKYYERSKMYMIAMDAEATNVKSIKPLGRNVMITYKPFFKSYFIIYEGADGQAYPLDLEFLYTNSKGFKVVKSKDGMKLEVWDNLSKGGDLSLVSVDPIMRDDGESFKVAFRITNQNMD